MAGSRPAGWLAVASCLLAVLAWRGQAAKCWYHRSRDQYSNCIQLDNNLVLYWSVVDNTTLRLAPDGDGLMNWIAIGISEAGYRGVDWNIVIPGQGLSWFMGDYFTTNASDPSTLALDYEENAVLETAPTYSKNFTLAEWTRPLDSCDYSDTVVFPDVARSILWGYNWKSDWDKDRFKFNQYIRGIKTGVMLYPTLATPAAADNTTVTLSAVMPKYPVPSANWSLACVNLPLPTDKPYHIIGYQGFNTSKLVRHIMGYVCAPGITAPAPGLNTPYSCSSQVLPVGCETLNMVWTPGAQRFEAPPEAGFAAGQGGPAVLVLQVHYQNPGGVVGTTDSSGFNLTLTPTLRPNAMGVLTLGNADLRIPLGNESYGALPNICPASCTSRRVDPARPVTLVTNHFVMGRLGSSVLGRHIRNNTAIRPVGRINYYDAPYTNYVGVFPTSNQLLPNDTFITICTYNTSGLSRTDSVSYVRSGLGPNDEICYNFVSFYPLSSMPNLDYCVADTRGNISTCSTRTKLAAMANATRQQHLAAGTKIEIGTLDITYFRSAECQIHDTMEFTPGRKPNTRAAVASIVLVPLALLIVGVILYSKYTKQEELEALLAEVREKELRGEGITIN